MKSIYKTWLGEGKLEHILTLIQKWRGEGAEIKEIAEKLGIHESTMYDYQNKYPEFAEALKKGKEIMDGQVENSLIMECLGYNYDETITTTTAIIDKATGEITSLEKVETKKVTKYARPSVTAIAYYLNNREANKWKNRVIFDGEDNGILPKLIEAMSNGKAEHAINE